MFRRFFARHRRGSLAGLAAGSLLGGVLAAVAIAAPAYAAPADGLAYVTNYAGNDVSVVNTYSQAVTGTIPVGTGPVGIVVNPAGTTAYVGDVRSGNGSVEVIDLSTDTVTTTINLGPGFVPGQLALSASGGTLAVSDLTQSSNALVALVSTASNTLSMYLSTGAGNDASYGLAVSSVGKVYVAGAVSNMLRVYGGPMANVPVGTTPTGVAVSPDGSQAYVTNNASGNVSVVSTASNTVTATIPTGSGSLPFGVIFNAAGTTAYATVASGLAVIDTSTQAVTTTASVSGDPWYPVLDPTGSYVYVPTSSGNTVAEVSTSTNTVARTLTGFSDPRDVAFGPAASADIVVGVSAQTLNLLSPAIQFNLTARDEGPDAVNAATLTASIPPGVTATNLSSGCSQSGATVVCDTGAFGVGTTATASFDLPVALLEIGTVTVDLNLTSSSPPESNPSGASASASCTVISDVLALC
jgi:YVTN family beta-propeller protein